MADFLQTRSIPVTVVVITLGVVALNVFPEAAREGTSVHRTANPGNGTPGKNESSLRLSSRKLRRDAKIRPPDVIALRRPEGA